LFDGRDLSHWKNDKGGPAKWDVKDGVATVNGSGSISTTQEFGDCQLHIEWASPDEVKGEGQGRGNSGIYFQNRYELQVLDSYKNKTYYHGQAGSIYKQSAPLVNASREPGEWQTYDIRLVGREVTTVLNGQKLYEKGVIDGLTGIAFDPFEGRPGPIELQGDHGGVEFRNVILVPLTKRK
jgi:hypothetical protein